MYMVLTEKLEPVPVVADQAGQDLQSVSVVLAGMREKGLVYSKANKEQVMYYGAAGYIPGFYEYNAHDMDRDLAELCDQYFKGGFKQKGVFLRTIPLGTAVNETHSALPYDDAKAIIKSKDRIMVQKCVCVSHQLNLGRECDQPHEVCFGFGYMSDYIMEKGKGRWVTLGLVLDSSGFPRRSHVYEGNVNEPRTLSEMLQDLVKGGTSTGQKPTVVMDAGIATEDNITWLQEHHYPYLVVSRKKHREFDEALSVVVKKDDESGNATEITWKQQPKPETTDTHPGVYCLRTSQTGWDESTLWNTYTMLTDLEAVFRSLKSELGLRPVHHQLAKRVAGHLFITVLAYHLVHAIRFRLKQTGIRSSWSSVRTILSSQSRMTVSMLCKNGSTVHVRKSNRPETNQQEIFSALGIKSHPGHAVKTTI